MLLMLALAFTSSGLVAQSYELFLKKFDSAKAVDDRKKMKKALVDDAQWAIQHYTYLVDTYVINGNTKVGERIELFKELWSETFKSTLLEKLEKVRMNLGEEERTMIRKLDLQKRKIWGNLEVARKAKDDEGIRKLADAMNQTAAQLEEVGDKLQAAECLAYVAQILSKVSKVEKSDMQAQLEAMSRYVVLHEEMDWTQGRVFKLNANYKKELERALRTGGSAKGPGGKGKGGEDGPAKFLKGSKWARYDMQISLEKKMNSGISLAASMAPLEWRAIFIEGEGPVECKFFQDGKIWIYRLGANKFAYKWDKDDKKEKFKPLKITGTKKASWLSYLKDGEITDYGFYTYIGGNRETVNATELNIQPEWGRNRTALIFFKSASILHAEIDGTRFQFFDENCNGIVGEKPDSAVPMGDLRMGGGLGQALAHPVFDTMRVGKSKKLLPFSSYVKVGDNWYRLKVTGNNESLRYRPLDPATIPSGHIVFKYKGPGKCKPDHLIVREVGFFKGATYDVAKSGTKGVEVPAGRYQVYYGRIQNGKPPRNMDAVIRPGNSQTFLVEAGKTFTLQLGAPYSIEYQMKRGKGSVTVDSSTFWVRGSFGEKYCDIGSEILEPELIFSRKNEGTKGKVVGKWVRYEGREIFSYVKTMRAKYPRVSALTLAWIPYDASNAKAPNCELKAKSPYKGTYYVGVRQKKHKLFGKLLPIWK